MFSNVPAFPLNTMMQSIIRFALAGIVAVVPSITFAQEASFKDVPKDHFAYEAVEFLKENSVISGYEDGTFRPGQQVNRAEAIKLIVAPLIQDAQLEQAKAATTVYSDIDNNAWYKPYVEIARVAGIVDGPPTKEKFNGSSPVLKAEFIKMILQAFGVDAVGSYKEISLPLSQDVTDTSAWFYPYIRFAVSSSMTMVSDEGTLQPGKSLTRGETAVMLYRYIMYQQGRRTQALLSEAESEILITLSFLEKKDLVEAEYASARALLAARGANTSRPNEPVVQGAVKVTEAFRSLVRGYRAGVNKDYDESIRLSGEAWNLAARGMELDSSLSTITEQVQAISKEMADAARYAKATPQAEASAGQ